MGQFPKNLSLVLVCLLALPVTGFAGSENLEEKQKPGEDVKEKPSETAEASGETLTNSIGMKFKLIPAGSFLMGSPDNEKGREKDEVQHKVTLTQPFYLGIYEVTQEQYEKVMGSNPSKFKGAKLPVETVNWNEAQDFCLKLSQLEKNMTYRLPTEAEWEYAARAGTKTAYYWGDDFDARYAWCAQNSGRKTQEVGTCPANPWGLFDMSGNVMEWCEDWSAAYPTGEQVDPKGAASGFFRVFRGGSWNFDPQICRSAFRIANSPDLRIRILGFRVVAVPAAGQ
jgi:formylglycine-generating enzyme required for sulfatase activity